MSSHRSSLFGQQRGGASKAPDRAGPHRADRDMEAELQAENDAMLDTVSVDMSRLRAAARTLRDEAEDHNRYLDSLEGIFNNAKDGVRGSITRLDGVMARYGCKDTFSFAVVLFVAMLVIYFVFRHVSFTSSGNALLTETPSAPSEG